MKNRGETSGEGVTSWDVHEIGCGSLATGWAIQRDTGRKVHADSVRKPDGPFYCGGCYSDAVHRYCHEVKHHFAHIGRTSALVPAKESKLHLECKHSIFEHLRAEFPNVKWICDDVVIKSDKTRKLCALKPDIGGRIEGQRVAIEIQATSLTLPRLLKRSLSYAQRNVSILWIVPLLEELGLLPFRPRLFERYLHSMYFGRTYYWYPGLGSKVQPVHYGVAYRHIPPREWYEDGEEQQAGGYDMPFKRIRKPNPTAPISIASAFHHQRRTEFRPWNELKTVPAMKILMDNLLTWWDLQEDTVLDRHYPDDGPER